MIPADATGEAETASTTAIDLSPGNPFFQNLGTNGRVCGTCHHEDQGWTVTPAFAQTLAASDPLFVFDGSDCLAPGTANPDPVTNSTEMLQYGNVRIELPIPATADYTLTGYTDPHHCSTPPGPSALRMYRRPLPTTNASFLATVLWDGRANAAGTTLLDHLKEVANDATIIHAQAGSPVPDATRTSISNFQLGLFHAQRQVGGLRLDKNGGNGGADYLYTDVLPGFFIGINDPFVPGFTTKIFDIYSAWEPGASPPNDAAAAIGRGEVVFYTKLITITNVPGINVPFDASQAPVAGACGVCHDTPNLGNHSKSLALNIGITSPTPPGGLDVGHLPTYTFQQNGTGKTITVTDPGRGLITGKFADLGKTKGPNLRGLAARAPYFHNGAAKDFATVVNFYDQRFNVGFTAQEKSDLIAFLGTL